MALTLQFYRGDKATMPKLAEGQPAFTLDERGFYIGDGTENIKYARADHKHPGGLFFSTDFKDLSNITINDGVYNQAAGRIEAGNGG